MAYSCHGFHSRGMVLWWLGWHPCWLAAQMFGLCAVIKSMVFLEPSTTSQNCVLSQFCEDHDFEPVCLETGEEQDFENQQLRMVSRSFISRVQADMSLQSCHYLQSSAAALLIIRKWYVGKQRALVPRNGEFHCRDRSHHLLAVRSTTPRLYGSVEWLVSYFYTLGRSAIV